MADMERRQILANLGADLLGLLAIALLPLTLLVIGVLYAVHRDRP